MHFQPDSSGCTSHNNVKRIKSDNLGEIMHCMSSEETATSYVSWNARLQQQRGRNYREVKNALELFLEALSLAGSCGALSEILLATAARFIREEMGQQDEAREQATTRRKSQPGSSWRTCSKRTGNKRRLSSVQRPLRLIAVMSVHCSMPKNRIVHVARYLSWHVCLSLPVRHSHRA